MVCSPDFQTDGQMDEDFLCTTGSGLEPGLVQVKAADGVAAIIGGNTGHFCILMSKNTWNSHIFMKLIPFPNDVNICCSATPT